MPCLITGLFTVLHTVFVYFEVLSKKDQDWSSIAAIFCLTWIVIYLMKRLLDLNPCKKQRYGGSFTLGTGIICLLAPSAKIQILELKAGGESTDTFLFFTSTCFCAAYFLLIRKPAKELEWSNKPSWEFDFIQCFLALTHLFFLVVTVVVTVGDRIEITDETERNTFIFHRIILAVMAALTCFDLCATGPTILSLWAFSSFYLCAILMRKLKVKESVERPEQAVNPVVDEDPVLSAEDAIQGD